MHHLVARRVWPLVVWTLFVWVPRIRNIWNDDELTTTGQVGRTALAVSLIVPALVVVGILVRHRGQPIVDRGKAVIMGFAGWTIAVWVIRGGAILFADHDGAFKAVHTALGVVSIGLSLLAVRSTTALPVERSSVASR